MGKVGRKGLVKKILKNLDEEEDDNKQEGRGEGNYLLAYDFKPKAHWNFYRNLKKIFSELEDGVMIQKSVVGCHKLKTARAVQALAEHYGAVKISLFEVARTIKVYSAEEVHK